VATAAEDRLNIGRAAGAPDHRHSPADEVRTPRAEQLLDQIMPQPDPNDGVEDI
jgi:hypothetical protein